MDGDMTTLELHTGSLRMNEVAHEIADGMADQTESLRVRTFRLPGGARGRARASGDLHGRAGQCDDEYGADRR